MSDIVFLRAWVPVYPDKVHFPVTNLLEPSTSEWVGAKTVGRLRFERGLLAPHSGDSSYTTIKRTTKRFNPLRLPASLEAALPFKSKPKDRGMHTKKKSAQAKAKAKKAINRHTAVVMDDYERKMTSLISSINAVRKTKLHKAKHAKIREAAVRALVWTSRREALGTLREVVRHADEFAYVDPVNGARASNQGIRFLFDDGSRIVFRLSGTGSSGATIRVYIEQYEPDASEASTPASEKLAPLVNLALSMSRMEEYTGRTEPTVIT